MEIFKKNKSEKMFFFWAYSLSIPMCFSSNLLTKFYLNKKK